MDSCQGEKNLRLRNRKITPPEDITSTPGQNTARKRNSGKILLPRSSRPCCIQSESGPKRKAFRGKGEVSKPLFHQRRAVRLYLKAIENLAPSCQAIEQDREGEAVWFYARLFHLVHDL